MLYVRPKVAELAFQLFGRSLHPELFELKATRTLERGDYRARVDITSVGHVVTWTCGGVTLTEVCSGIEQPLPRKKRLLSHRLRGERNDEVECRGGVHYQVSMQLETAEPDVFWNSQQELVQDSQLRGMLYRFSASGRMSLGAISYINLETRQRSLLIQAFHTFPDDYAIVKSQSLFELP